MRIAIDCRPIVSPDKGEMAGIGHYARFLVRHLLKIDEENRYTLFFDERASRGTIGELIGSARNAEAKLLQLSRFKKLLPYAYSHRYVSAAIAGSEADVYHGTTGSLPMAYRGRSVITIHDLAIYAHPEWFPGGQFFSRRFVVPASVRNAAKVIAVSHFTKREIQRVFAVPAEKIAVVYEGVEPPPPDAWETPAPKDLRKPYILYLGTIEPRKNVEGLVHAYASLAERFPKLVGATELVIAGGRGWKSERAFAAVAQANKRLAHSGPRVRVLGYVPDKDKYALMAHAQMFVFPSWHEGFGLPVLEAMNLGVPVITSNVTALPEIAGRGAALLVDPGREEELALAMKHLLEDDLKRGELARRGLERSTEYRWDKTAGETLEVYEEAAKTKR
ncbi:MAG TPA: glycosyltransferase family 1 protein [Candidatus Baltobacteraceae bacterium]|nr:glycosyltransferase family 1 protein [Candidatus Baltobacteraceae bacterium]